MSPPNLMALKKISLITQSPISAAHTCICVGPSTGAWTTFQGHTLRETDSSRPSVASQLGDSPPTPRVGMSTGLSLLRWRAGTHSCCKLMSAVFLSSLENTFMLVLHRLLSQSVYSLSCLSSEPCGGGVCCRCHTCSRAFLYHLFSAY